MTAAERFAEVPAYQTHIQQQDLKSKRAWCAAADAAWDEDWLRQQEPGKFTAEDARAARLAHAAERSRTHYYAEVAPKAPSMGRRYNDKCEKEAAQSAAATAHITELDPYYDQYES